MQSMLKEAGLAEKVECDSCGTSAQLGEPADPRMQSHAGKRGYKLLSQSRPFSPKDFERFDYIFTMDQHNYEHVMSKASQPGHKAKVHKMTSFCSQFTMHNVPDPYYGGDEGFERVLDILEDSCQGVLNRLLSKLLTKT